MPGYIILVGINLHRQEFRYLRMQGVQSPTILLRLAAGLMPYSLSGTKLQNYHRRARAYYFRYELGMSGPVSFGSASLGSLLHQALASIYRNWHYQDPLP